MVVLGAVKTGARLSEQPLSGSAVGSFAVMLLLVLGLHLAMFWLGLTLARLSGLTRADQLAVGFAGSQKTLLVGMNVSLHQGFSVLPMISWHVGQLFLDTFLADRLRRPDDESL
jgi:sodium/bile acid cotransporter 7